MIGTTAGSCAFPPVREATPVREEPSRAARMRRESGLHGRGMPQSGSAANARRRGPGHPRLGKLLGRERAGAGEGATSSLQSGFRRLV